MQRTVSIILLFLLASATAFGQPRKDKKNKSALKQAKEHLQYEEFHDAIPHIQELLESDENSAYYNFWMGKSLYVTYQRNKALPYFEKVEKINPQVDEDFHYYYGLTLHYNLLFDRAITEYKLDLERYEPGTDAYKYVNNRISQCEKAREIVKRKEGEQVKINNMGQKINTPYAEHSPVISADDSMLIFTARRPESLGAEPEQHFYDEDLYVSYKNGDEWSKAVNIGTPVNSKGHDATISLTADAKTLYIYRHKKAGGLYKTEFDEEFKKWDEPKAVERPLNSKYYEASICESAEKDLIFFTSDRPGGYGGRDIYLVKKDENDKWGEPINLGAPINTPFDEDAPYFHPDGKTLYYSSNGPQSMGGFDIFVTELAEGTWLEPLNMGYPVNTPDDDIYFVLSANGKSGYYSSGKEGGFGEKDIYNIEFPYFPYPRRYNIIELAGVVQDVNSLDTIPATIFLVDNETLEVLDSVKTGPAMAQFYFVLEPERSYSLMAVSDGYNSTEEEVLTPILYEEDVLMERTLLLNRPSTPDPKPEEPALVLPEIQNIYFDFDEYSLRQESKNELDMIVDLLAQNDKLDVTIKGHTDWYGTYDYNVKLSENRTNAAYHYLTSNGIPDERIHITYFSENVPIETNTNDEGRQFNRRCEFAFSVRDRVVLTSAKLRTGIEGIRVDHETPKGLPGFDNPDGTPQSSGAVAALSGSSTAEDFTWNDTPQGASEDINEEPAEEEGLVVKNDDRDADVAFAALMDKIDLHHIYFDFDKYDIRQESKNELAKVKRLLEENADVEVRVYGHTDAYGSNSYNQRLSENRANQALEYLVANGVPQNRIALTGYSEEKPIDTNENASGRQNNRRVEFQIVKNGKVIFQSRP